MREGFFGLKAGHPHILLVENYSEFQSPLSSTHRGTKVILTLVFLNDWPLILTTTAMQTYNLSLSSAVFECHSHQCRVRVFHRFCCAIISTASSPVTSAEAKDACMNTMPKTIHPNLLCTVCSACAKVPR